MKLLRNLIIGTVVATLNLSALALPITITGPSPSNDIASGTPDPIAWGPETGNSEIKAYIQATYGVSLLYKSEAGPSDGVGVEEGDFAPSYKTTFSNSANDPSDALIEYVGGAIINANPVYL